MRRRWWRSPATAPTPAVDIFAAAQRLASLRRVYRVAPPDGVAEAGGPAHPFPDPSAVAPPPPAPDDNPDKIVYLAFTSGTTGKPKGVLHSDNTLLANGRAMVADWGHDAQTVLLSLSPLSHHIATVAVEQMLVAGLELVVNDPPPGMTALDWLVASGATYVMGVPTHAMDMLEAMRGRGLDRLGAVKIFYMAGAPIPRETAQAFLDLGVTPQNIYGMTENGSHQYTLPHDDARTIVATCGRACRGYAIKIWNAEVPIPRRHRARSAKSAARGGLLMLGYFDNQAATETSFNRRGWFMSGDLGRVDAQGCLEIMGRKKDLIIRGGRNIYPARIEDLALKHPAVARAAAFAVPDRRLGEKVCLAVVPHGGRGAGARCRARASPRRRSADLRHAGIFRGAFTNSRSPPAARC